MNFSAYLINQLNNLIKMKNQTSMQEEIATILACQKKQWIKPEMEAMKVNNSIGFVSDMGEPGTGRS